MNETRPEPPNENPHIATVPGDAEGGARRVVSGGIQWRKSVSALQHRNFRLFFAGSAVSLVGTWMQTVAEGWLVYEMTNSPLALGLIRFLHTMPVTGLTLIGGAFADRFNKRNILLITQSATMMLAFVLFVLVHFGWVEVWHVAVIGFSMGLAHSFDIPARQSFIIELVGKKDLLNAIALNSSMFNGARVLGPAVAGMVIAFLGLAACFLINGLSFLAIILAYLAMKLPPQVPNPVNQSIRAATMEAVRYVVGQKFLRAVLLLVMTVSMFGWPYAVLMPVIARDTLGLQAAGYSYLMALNGIGAFLGAIMLATLGDYQNKLRLVFGGVVGFSLALIVFALSSHIVLAGISLMAAGWFMITFFATANSVVQLHAPNALRGRIMGIYSFCFIGVSPVGSLLAGYLAKKYSASYTILLGAILCLGVTLVTIFRARNVSTDVAPDPDAHSVA